MIESIRLLRDLFRRATIDSVRSFMPTMLDLPDHVVSEGLEMPQVCPTLGEMDRIVSCLLLLEASRSRLWRWVRDHCLWPTW